MKKKIIFVVTRSDWGGAQKYVFDCATNLPTDRFESLVVTGGSGALITELQKAGIRVIVMPELVQRIAPLADMRALQQLIRIFALEHPDVVHLNSSKIGGLGAMAARIAGIKKIIFTAHGWPWNEDRSWVEKILFRCAIWCGLFLHETVICVSDAVRRDAPTVCIDTKKYQVIKIGVAAQPLLDKQTARALLEKKYNAAIPKNAYWIGSIAELGNNKGLAFGMHAVRQLDSRTHWFVIGEGTLRKKLELLAKQFHLEERVHFVGAIPNAARLVNAFDCILIPSITEGLGYVALEAGAGTAPVVASNVGGIPEVIVHEQTGLLVPTKNPEAIASAIKKLQYDPVLSAQLAERLHEKIIKEYAMEKMLQQTIACYES